MKFRNATEHAAVLRRTLSARADDHMIGCVIARATYRLDGGELVATPDAPWPIEESAHETPIGESPGDRCFYSGGVDVLVGGAIRHPDGSGSRMDLELEVGRTFRRRIVAFGDRVWERAGKGKLTPSAPRPFKTMTLGYERAFGGYVDTEYGVRMPFAANPAGRGFYLSDADAEGQPLPNLEAGSQLIASYNDHPDPVGLGYYPMTGGLRAVAAVDHPVADAIRAGATTVPKDTPAFRPEDLLPSVFNLGHPGMVIEVGKEPIAGDRVRLSNAMREGELAFRFPSTEMHIHVQLEDRNYAFPMHLDQIALVAGEGVVMLSWRSVFEYALEPRDRRFATLHDGPLPDPVPAGYPVELTDEWPHQWDE